MSFRRVELILPQSSSDVSKSRSAQKTIVVYGVSHIAEKELYDAVLEDIDIDKYMFSDDGHVVHMEGVQHKSKSRSYSLMDCYRFFAEISGLENQKDYLNSKIDHITLDVPWSGLSRYSKAKVNIAEKIVGRYVVSIERSSRDKREEVAQSIREALVKKYSSPRGFFSELQGMLLLSWQLTHGRSQTAARYAHFDNNNVSMVWGAAHVPAIVKELKKSGYIVISDLPIRAKSKKKVS